MDNHVSFSPCIYRLTVTDVSLSKRQKPKSRYYDFNSVFDCIECFLSTPKRFNPTITKLLDVAPGNVKAELSGLFSNDDVYFDLSNIKIK